MAKSKKENVENKDIKKEEKSENSPVLKKKFNGLSEYKAKNNIREIEYKPQEWLNMSPAFKDITKLPGLPLGHMLMNYGKSDVGKTTMLMEAGAFCQTQGILPVLVLTENKFSWSRAEKMGLIKDEAIVFDGIQTIEDGVDRCVEIIRDQEKGNLPYDLFFLWDSIGMTPSKAEWNSQQEDGSKTGMMVTARVLREKFTRFLAPMINQSRKKEYPYTNSMLVVNHAYTAPPKPPSTISTIEPYGGDGIYLASSLVFRQGGIMSRSSKITALVVEKNHVTNVAAYGNVCCTDHGFILDTKDSIDEYKSSYRDGWDLEFDKYWEHVSLD
jgi:hypothetical protein